MLPAGGLSSGDSGAAMLSYSTPKTVRYADWRLGAAYTAMALLFPIYIMYGAFGRGEAQGESNREASTE
jgi:hypothetical protein